MKMFDAISEKIRAFSPRSGPLPALSAGTLTAGLLLCCILALGLRACRWYAEPVLSRDGLKYVMQAGEIQDRRLPEAERKLSPHYFYAEYLSSRLFGLSPHRLGAATNMVLGSLLPLLFFAIARSLFRDGETALCCALLGAVHPQLVAFSIEVQREIPYLFFCGLFFLSAINYYRSRRWGWNIGMAAAAVLSLCFRYEGAELLLFALAVHGVSLRRDGARRRRSWIAPGVFLVSFSLFLFGIFWALGFSPADAAAGVGRKLPVCRMFYDRLKQ